MLCIILFGLSDMNRLTIIALACVTAVGCATAPDSRIGLERGTAPSRSTGFDTYNRVLEVRVSDLAKRYRLGSPIPITVRITNLGPRDSGDSDIPSKHPTAQLFPHLTVWVEKDGRVLSERFPLPIENRIRIKKGQTFERTVDLSLVRLLSTAGKYLVSVGHWNGAITDLGDWTGTLRSRSQAIVLEN